MPKLTMRACKCTGDVCQCTTSDFNPRKETVLLDNISAANLASLVEPIAAGFEACAGACEAAGIGGHISHGHAAIARRMAADIRSNAVQGRLPGAFCDAGLHAAADDEPEPATLPAETMRILGKLLV